MAICRPVVADSHHFDVEQDPEPHQSKSRIRIRNLASMSYISLQDKGSNVTVVKHEENGVIPSAAVVSAETDDAEFRDQEIFCQLLLFQYLFCIIYTYRYMEIQLGSIWYRIVPSVGT